jgi:hypothetical protein
MVVLGLLSVAQQQRRRNRGTLVQKQIIIDKGAGKV